MAHQVQEHSRALQGLGVARDDRVAIVLPNGPEMAVCFLSVASAAVCAPLNPAYSQSEFEFYLGDLKPAAMIVDAERPIQESPAISAAAKLDIPVVRLTRERERSAGSFRLDRTFERRRDSRSGAIREEAAPGDTALVLHTSGSTSRPKQVPLTHANLCASAASIRKSLDLSSGDRCLNIMPLFHIHGLVGALLSSIDAGASVVCTSGFDAPNFLDWLNQFLPTWYTAVPSMHRAILDRTAADRSLNHLPQAGESQRRPRLRFIRSCSAALPPKLMAELEETFRVPVIEAYGMTEASHQMSVNPLPPGTRKPGSVGKATGCEIAIRGEDRTFLPPGSEGDIVIRGGGVISGYVNNDEANASSFADGWFSTGDRGRLDEDGYLFLTGRSKEIINRGGEKLSPREIDETLLEHPAVAQALAFAVPHERLGEDVAALVVLREPNQNAGQLETKLREFVGKRLVYFKVPRRILFVDEIPKGPTGKPQRIGLAERLGLDEASLKQAAAPAALTAVDRADMIESTLSQIWEDVLRRRPIAAREDFFEIGGDSLLAARVLVRVETVFGQTIGMASFAAEPTIAQMAQRLRDLKAQITPSSVVAIQSSGSRPPLFVVGFSPLLRPLILRMSDDQPIHGISLEDLSAKPLPEPFRLEDLAARQIETLRNAHPRGPYLLAGWCADGLVAQEMAHQLRLLGEEVPVLVMFDSVNPLWRKQQSRWATRIDRLKFHFENLAKLDRPGMRSYCRDRLNTLILKLKRVSWRVVYKFRLRTDRRRDHQLRNMSAILNMAASEFEPQPYPGRVVLVRPQVRPAGFRSDAAESWRNLLPDLQVIDVPGDHVDMFREPCVADMALALNAALQDACASSRIPKKPPASDDRPSQPRGQQTRFDNSGKTRNTKVRTTAAVFLILAVFYLLPTLIENHLNGNPRSLQVDLLLGDLLGCLAIALSNWKLGSALYLSLGVVEYFLLRTSLLSLPALAWFTDLVPAAVLSVSAVKKRRLS